MDATAVLLSGPKHLGVEALPLVAPGVSDVVVDIKHSGISTGTEKLFWTGEMPPFPGMGYPLVPGYEAAGEVVEAGALTGYKPGDFVFVPGANCFEGAFGLFGGAASRVVSDSERVTRIDPGFGAEASLLALAATARHAMAGQANAVPDLIVGHGVLGRLLARLTVASGAPAPTVWDINPERRQGDFNYPVIDPADDRSPGYNAIYDATGQSALLDTLVGRLHKGGEIVLAGFYAEPVQFAYPTAFMKEARFRVAAEWQRDDLDVIRTMVEAGDLSLSDLITHQSDPNDAAAAYEQAFTDSACLKMVLNWGCTT